VSVPSAVSSNGIRCSLEGVAVVKVGGTEDAHPGRRPALPRPAGRDRRVHPEVLAGSLRAIVGPPDGRGDHPRPGRLRPEVAEEAENSLTNQGLVLDTFQLQDIQAEGTYLADLGRPRRPGPRRRPRSPRPRPARVRAGPHPRRGGDRRGQPRAQLKQAEIKAETDAAEAEADAAGPLAQAAKDQEVIVAQEQVAARRAELKERELDTEVRKPADAQRYAVEQEAEGRKNAAIRDAEAVARPPSPPPPPRPKRTGSSVPVSASAARSWPRPARSKVAPRARPRRPAARRIAAAVQVEGDAEAAAILARWRGRGRGHGEEGRRLRALRRRGHRRPAGQGPARGGGQGAEPIGAIDKLTVISTDGASQLTKSVTNNVAQGLQLASDLTGVDLSSLFAQLASRTGQAVHGHQGGARQERHAESNSDPALGTLEGEHRVGGDEHDADRGATDQASLSAAHCPCRRGSTLVDPGRLTPC
jgi:flotillin